MRWVYRYSALVRAGHWINALSIGILLMSGLQIFNAHPALYWGEDSDFEQPILSIYNAFTPEGRRMGVPTSSDGVSRRRDCLADPSSTAGPRSARFPPG